MTDKCPHCGKDMSLPPYGEHNVAAYGDPVMIRTECCKKPVRLIPIRLIPVRTITVEAITHTNRVEDDWGRKFKKE